MLHADRDFTIAFRVRPLLAQEAPPSAIESPTATTAAAMAASASLSVSANKRQMVEAFTSMAVQQATASPSTSKPSAASATSPSPSPSTSGTPLNLNTPTSQRKSIPHTTAEDATLVILEPKKTLRKEDTTERRSFHAHRVYRDTAATAQLYQQLMEPLLPFAMTGGFANVLAYGQTGSGKTYTMSQSSLMVADGIFRLPLASQCDITIAAIEIYGTELRDLLVLAEMCGKHRASAVSSLDNDASTVHVYEDVQGKVQVDARHQPVRSRAELVDSMQKAWAQRQTQATLKNDTSSRSHAILRLQFTSKTDRNAMVGVLQLIDLAGSERAASDSAQHSKERMQESVHINKSLMTLKECIRQRCLAGSTANPHIPYRGSKLTLILKEAFELSSMQPAHTVFIATVSPLVDDISASINTLRYASALMITPPKHSAASTEVDPKDVFQWSHQQVKEWLQLAVGPVIPDVSKTVVPFENGRTLSKIPEQEFMRRLLEASDGKLGDKRARAIYIEFWKMVVKSRTQRRREERAAWTKAYKEKRDREDQDELQELLRRKD